MDQFTHKRSVVICAEDTPAAAAAAGWAVSDLYREGDTFHLVYVVKSLKPPMAVHHSVPGTSYQFSQPGAHHEGQTILAAKKAITDRYLPVLTPKMVPYQLHLYAERYDASPKCVGDLILKTAAGVDPAPEAVILAAHNRPTDRDRFEGEVGSVAATIMKNCKLPLILVRPTRQH